MKLKWIIRVVAVVLVALIILGYAGFAFRDIFRGPQIIVNEPINGSSFASSSVAIKGVVDRVQSIELNGRLILIDEQGNFNEIVLLSPGYNVETLQAKDKFGRSTEARIELIKN